MKRIWSLMVGAVVVFGAGCGGSETEASDAAFESKVTDGMRSSVETQLVALHAAAVELQKAAPTPSGRGWDAKLDADAIAAMKAAWIKTRVAYESIEGATAPQFPQADYTMDARYDDYLAKLGPKGDQDLFDDQGVTGMHGIERILYAPEIPADVIKFESGLPGYKAAAFPATAAEAVEFKTKLCQKLVDDSQSLATSWNKESIVLSEAFSGLISLMNEQQEKVVKAATGEEESRYSNRTLFDLHNNLQGTRTIYGFFSPWIKSKASGSSVDGNIQGGFGKLQKLYDSFPGVAIPPVPTNWSSVDLSEDDLKKGFGLLFSDVEAAVDPNQSSSVVGQMNSAATLLGYPQFQVGD